ncbi:hypothetical protein ASPSYDRAFT_35371 [Aspergillus sydowii CBS 593.65]|uniref:Uncharacterized protein n=1 Tax=Aspergillus sydowii CBS 593.65 TaxID=1036612 RepID=A0A1L9T5H1_9EURO|nr:uncharacterized protein ASPSYDRAFT_35371 [Aspergillus sydowii CBS 593.65]OJJ54692.1 hypothetical protein ASPSYDRAFT_35371 [Aspergillus sydowii CBS 593.65]
MARHSASTPSGNRKRRREAPGATEDWSPGPSNPSGPFPENTKRAILTAAAMRCFICTEKHYHSAHIIEEADRSIPIIEQRGLINFKPRSQLNVVGLCPNCHTNYNDHRDPNVAFYPTDLQFLIRFELRDRARRGKESPRERITPTAAQYVRQCGLYNRIQLDWKGLDTYKVLEPAAWNGAPLATIPRTFAMMSCPRVGGIPKQDREDLSSSGTYTTAMMTRKCDQNFGIDPEIEFDNNPEGGGDDATLGGSTDLGAVDEKADYEDDEDGMPSRKRRALAGSWKTSCLWFQ